jgi:hypothetical protein
VSLGPGAFIKDQQLASTGGQRRGQRGRSHVCSPHADPGEAVLQSDHRVLPRASGDSLIAQSQPRPGSPPFKAHPTPEIEWTLPALQQAQEQTWCQMRQGPFDRATSTARESRLVGEWGIASTHSAWQIFCVRLDGFWQGGVS